MSELAFNYQGQRFVPPSEAVFWRVRRIRDGQRGQLDIVRDGEGLPLVVPLDIGIDDFRTAVDNQPGRYRLDALSEDKLAMRDVPAAYVNVPAQRRPAVAEVRASEREVPAADVAAAAPPMVTAPFGTWPALPMPMGMSGTEYLLAEALRGQVQMFQMLTTALSDRVGTNAAGASQLIGAAAELVRAADGAAMPRRRPLELPLPPLPAPVVTELGARNAAPVEGAGLDDEEPGDDGETTRGDKDEMDGVIDKLGKVMSAIGPSVPHLVSLVRGYPPAPGTSPRNAAPEAPAEGEDTDAEPETADDAEPGGVTPTMVSHLILIAQLLGEDGPLLRRVLQRMEPDARHALIDHLCAMSVEEAVEAARTQLGPVKARMASQAARPRTADRAGSVSDAAPSGGGGATDGDGVDSDGDVPAADATSEVADDAIAPPRPMPPPTQAELEAHMLQIARHLTLPEVLQARSLIGSLSESERTQWSQKLIALDPAAAATVVSVELARRAGA